MLIISFPALSALLSEVHVPMHVLATEGRNPSVRREGGAHS